MDIQERILCAAIHYPDMESPNPSFKNGYNVEGYVACGFRHVTVLHDTACNERVHGLFLPKEHVQGFLTSTNRFVDRKEAWVIAEKANQIVNRDAGLHEELFSENLY